MSYKTSLYWHDYETFGRDPARDKVAQFAGLRTDEDLNIIGDPLLLYCQPGPDCLPEPEACLLTGITPQLAAAQGEPEALFIAAIHQELSRPGTCGVGYNSLRFDDEFTRHLLYRNFYDPYEREYKNGNSRWDIIDMLRMAYALRPEGIEWPRNEVGQPSFRLEDLTAANGIAHQGAHDALADVRATIDLARLLKQRQPRLYAWLYELRNKHKAAQQLDLYQQSPVLHSSRMFPTEYGCTALVMPLAVDPHNRNGIIVYDLRHDPAPLFALSVEEIRYRLFTPTAELPEGVTRIALKTVHTNKSPALAPYKTLDDASAERLHIDREQSLRHHAALHGAPGLAAKLQEVFAKDFDRSRRDPELMLYGGGFLNDSDKRALQAVRACPPSRLGAKRFHFHDPRLAELLFRYRARNYPETLSPQEQQRWQDYCQRRLHEEDGGGSLTLETYWQKISALESEADAAGKAVLQQLREYGKKQADFAAA